VGPGTGLDHEDRRKFLLLLGLELRPSSYQARSQFLYRLRSPGSNISLEANKKSKFCVSLSPASADFFRGLLFEPED
jgi:hypothetical protein